MNQYLIFAMLQNLESYSYNDVIRILKKSPVSFKNKSFQRNRIYISDDIEE